MSSPRAHTRLQGLRTDLRGAVPGLGASHAAEALARSLGHRTHAALLASLGDGPEPSWAPDLTLLLGALRDLGHGDQDAAKVAAALAAPWDARAETAPMPGPFTCGWDRSTADALFHFQSSLVEVVAILFPRPVLAPRTGTMASGHDVGTVAEAWHLPARDCVLAKGRQDGPAMARAVGWAVMASFVADMTGRRGLDRGALADVRRLAGEIREAPLSLPWPGAMGAGTPDEGLRYSGVADLLRSHLFDLQVEGDGPDMAFNAMVGWHRIRLPRDRALTEAFGGWTKGIDWSRGPLRMSPAFLPETVGCLRADTHGDWFGGPVLNMRPIPLPRPEDDLGLPFR